MSREYEGTRDTLWIIIRSPYTNKVLFRYDPERDLIEVVERGQANLIDLREERAKLLSAIPS